MADKRILKTKKCLKTALHDLIVCKPFEKISVTEICEHACTGRGTFYTYYNDKYELLEDCFSDLQSQALTQFNKLQSTNNPGNQINQSFHNLIDVVMDITIQFASTSKPLLENTDLLLMYYRFLIENLESFELVNSTLVKTEYSKKQINTFFILGFYGFVHTSRPEMDDDSIRRNVHKLAQDLLDSPIFISAT